jgi:hypothetical protein
MESIREASPRLKARIAGVFDLLEMLTGGFAILLVGGARSLSIDGNSLMAIPAKRRRSAHSKLPGSRGGGTGNPGALI